MFKISIIVPIYNAESVINKCTDSILAQTLKEIELILVNDGSTDNSLNICKEIKRADSRVKLYDIANSGPANARNYGLEKATGEYVGFVDADDYIHNEMYSKLYQTAKLYSGNIDIVMCGYNEIRVESNDLVSRRIIPAIPDRKKLNSNEIEKFIITKYYNGEMNGIGSLWNKIYRNKFLVENNLSIDPTFIRAEDYWFNFECYNNSSSLIFLSEPLYFYIKDTPGSVMKTYRANQFDLFLFEREKLKTAYNYNFQVDHKRNDEQFLCDTIEFIYLLDSSEEKSFRKISKILVNGELIASAKNSKLSSVHLNIMRKLIQFKQPWLYFFVMKLVILLLKFK